MLIRFGTVIIKSFIKTKFVPRNVSDIDHSEIGGNCYGIVHVD